MAHTLYACGRCGERFLGVKCRCGDCHVFARAVGLGGLCPECDTPLLIERSARRGGASHHVNPQRRANRRGHAVLLAQNLENPCGVYHMAHSGLLTTASSFHVFNLATQTGRRRVFIMTTIQTQRPTLVYVACFYPAC